MESLLNKVILITGTCFEVSQFVPVLHFEYSPPVIIIIINPLTARVVGAPQMILQPVFSIFSLFSTALWN